VTTAAAAEDVARQGEYHRRIFGALYRWDELWPAAVDLAGDEASAASLGIDQLGHFGPQGVELVAERMLAALESDPATVVELGSGFGGVLRQLGRILRSQDVDASLLGIELVPEQRSAGIAIGRAIGDAGAEIIEGDVRQLPLGAGSTDAVVACGSASHFSAMDEVLRECHRVLRPGGVLVMTEEVSLRPAGGPPVGEEFLRLHPPGVFPPATPEQRRSELDASGLSTEAFEPVVDWALPLLRDRVGVLRMLLHCGNSMFGEEPYALMMETLASAADEYERGSVQPTLVVARRF
jgi:SAM-dependent methyltransferase